MAKKILLADDSITIQKVVELTFAEGDYEVVCASDGAQAIRKIEEVVPDIALVDVMMPQRNGYDVCGHVKKDPNLAWIPVLLLTGTFEPYDPKRAEEVGADGHIIKPFESRALVGQVEELIGRYPRPASHRGDVGPAPARVADRPPTATPAGGTHGIAPADAAPPESEAATVRIDSRDFVGMMEFRGKETPEPPAPAPSSPGPLDLHGGEAPVEPTQPIRSGPRAPVRETRAPERGEMEGTAHRSVEEMAQPIIEKAAEQILREIAWEVIPDLAESIIRKRIRELEEEAAAQEGAAAN